MGNPHKEGLKDRWQAENYVSFERCQAGNQRNTNLKRMFCGEKTRKKDESKSGGKIRLIKLPAVEVFS